MHQALRSLVMPQFVVDVPTEERALAALDDHLSTIADQAAAMIIEPLVQGAGGMRFHSPAVLAPFMPWPRNTTCFSSPTRSPPASGAREHASRATRPAIAPDILCLGKALTGGTIGLGATLATEEIFSAFLSEDWGTALMHGPTFMANPLACAAANASLDLFEREPAPDRVHAIEAKLQTGLEPCRGLPQVVDVRVKGAIGVVQLDERIDVFSLRPRFVERGSMGPAVQGYRLPDAASGMPVLKTSMR